MNDANCFIDKPFIQSTLHQKYSGATYVIRTICQANTKHVKCMNQNRCVLGRLDIPITCTTVSLVYFDSCVKNIAQHSCQNLLKLVY